jgi:FHA domain-containing protein
VSSCPRCKAINPASERSCLSCGASLDAADANCPQGHPVDPTWAACPYCALQGKSMPLAGRVVAKPPRVAAPPPSRRAAPPVPPPELSAVAGSPTPAEPVPDEVRASGEAPPPAVRRASDEAAAAMRRTRLAGAPPGLVPTPASVIAASETIASPSAAGEEPARTLVAVLAAPGLRPGGAAFPVRVGKSFLGAHPSNDVCLRDDAQVSSEHAVLLARHGRFFLADRMSSNGTWVNGEEVAAGSQTELHDRDRIRCGASELVLLVLPSLG